MRSFLRLLRRFWTRPQVVITPDLRVTSARTFRGSEKRRQELSLVIGRKGDR